MSKGNFHALQAHIRPETSSVEVAPKAAKPPGATKLARMSALCAVISVLMPAAVTSLFRSVAPVQVFLYVIGAFASLAAVLTGVIGLLRLRKSTLPRGRLAGWCGLVLGGITLAIVSVTGGRLIAGGLAAYVEDANEEYRFERPEGWMVLPSNVFDSGADLEIMALDGGAYAFTGRRKAGTLADGVAGFLASVYLIPRSRGHHNGPPRTQRPALFKPLLVRLPAEEIERLKKRSDGQGEPGSMLRSLVREKVGRYHRERYGTVFKVEQLDGDRTKGRRVTAEVVLEGKSPDGGISISLAMLWLEGGYCYRLVAIAPDGGLERLEREMRPLVTSFRIQRR